MGSLAINHRGTTRSTWVWVALLLQGMVFLATLWSSLRVLSLWSKFAPQAPLALFRALSLSSVEAVASGIALAGLWQSKRWGWILGVTADAAMCLFTLSNLVQYSTLLLRNPRWFAFSVWDFAALAVLLHRPVRAYFLGQMDLPQQMTAQGTNYATKGAEPREVHWIERGLRVLVYFVAAMCVTCFVTTFSLLLQLGQKAGGVRGFAVMLVFGFVLGSGPSFLFTLLLTITARIFRPFRLWAWLLWGALLPPGLVLGMGTAASRLDSGGNGAGARILAVFFTGPMWLFQAWWLTIPAGLIAAFVCFQLFPWAFGQPATE